MSPSVEGLGASVECSNNYFYPSYNDNEEDRPQMVSMTYYIKIKKAVLLMKQIGHIKNNFLSESLRTIEYILCLNEMI